MGENKLNKLERSIMAAEDGAEDARWMQAEEVVRRLGTHPTKEPDKQPGEHQRDIAASWTNLRTGRPYSQQHVSFCAKAWRTSGLVEPRPAWKVAYMDAGGRGDRWAPTREEQPPTTVETAEKLVRNIMAKAPDAVQDAVYHGLKMARAGVDTSPAARKAATAAADEATAPVVRAVATIHTDLAVQAQREVTDHVREVVQGDAVTAAWMRKMDKAVNETLELLAEVRFGLGVDA